MKNTSRELEAKLQTTSNRVRNACIFVVILGVLFAFSAHFFAIKTFQAPSSSCGQMTPTTERYSLLLGQKHQFDDAVLLLSGVPLCMDTGPYHPMLKLYLL